MAVCGSLVSLDFSSGLFKVFRWVVPPPPNIGGFITKNRRKLLVWSFVEFVRKVEKFDLGAGLWVPPHRDGLPLRITFSWIVLCVSKLSKFSKASFFRVSGEVFAQSRSRQPRCFAVHGERRYSLPHPGGGLTSWSAPWTLAPR